MADLENKLAELEESIYNAEIVMKHDKSYMKNDIKSFKIEIGIAVLLPFLIATILYFSKPKYIQKNKKIDNGKFVRYTVIYTFVAWSFLMIIISFYPRFFSKI